MGFWKGESDEMLRWSCCLEAAARACCSLLRWRSEMGRWKLGYWPVEPVNEVELQEEEEVAAVVVESWWRWLWGGLRLGFWPLDRA